MQLTVQAQHSGSFGPWYHTSYYEVVGDRLRFFRRVKNHGRYDPLMMTLTEARRAAMWLHPEGTVKIEPNHITILDKPGRTVAILTR